MNVNFLPNEHVLYIEIQSDLYGFPRLVGTHYLPTDSVHDTLADYGVYRRIDAQADWVVARSRGDYITEDWAYQHLIDSDILRNMGADLHLVDAKPYSDSGNYQKVSEKLAKTLEIETGKKTFWAGQFENISNYKFHEKTTAKEIFDQTNGTVDGFTCAIGTGGTITGVSVGLKNLNKNIHIACTDSQGSSMYNYFTNGNPEKKGDESITEGIGQARVTKNLENCTVDSSFFVTDSECMNMLYKLIKTEGLFLGLSSGVNICGAIKLGKKLGPNKKIVTILCDDANKYYDKMFNKEYLQSKNLPIPDWL